MLRCCGGDSGGGGRNGDGGRGLRPGCWEPRRRSDSSATAYGGGRRQKYRRVSGRTCSSVELPVDVDVTAAAPPTTGLADCWRRVLKGPTAGGVGSSSGGGSSGSSGGSSTARSARVHGDGGHQPAVGPMAQSSWTMISNSSLKDVDSDDLRDELVGYAVDAATITTTTTTTTSTTACTDCDFDGGERASSTSVIDHLLLPVKNVRVVEL